jgi:hypothetical protein
MVTRTKSDKKGIALLRSAYKHWYIKDVLYSIHK